MCMNLLLLYVSLVCEWQLNMHQKAQCIARAHRELVLIWDRWVVVGQRHATHPPIITGYNAKRGAHVPQALV